MTSRFCIIWLQVACGVTFVVGLVAAAGSSAVTSGLWLLLFDLLKWPIDGNPDSFGDTSFAINAVLGGVMAGWAVLMYAVVTRLFAAGHCELCLPMLSSIVVWFVVDSAGSLAAGLPGNVIFNVAFLVFFTVPLTMLWRGAVQSDGPR